MRFSKGKTFGITVVVFCFTTVIFLAGCMKIPKPPPHDEGCGLLMAMGNSGLNGADHNCSYVGALIPVKEGGKMVLTGKFPHSRCATIVLYDQELMIIDYIKDVDIEPSTGENQWRPGVKRDGKDLGTFKITVMIEPPPQAERPPNTLYAGMTKDGKKNQTALIIYRNCLNDQGYGIDDTDLAVYGGSSQPVIWFYDSRGDQYCPSKITEIGHLLRGQLKIRSQVEANEHPYSLMDIPKFPPQWFNINFETVGAGLPNVDTAYLQAPVSAELGELLVLRWQSPVSPEDTYYGKPFPSNYDVRYWSIGFNYYDMDNPAEPLSVKTIADINVPVLPDGTRQLVIGMKGTEWPDFVPPEQWVGLDHEELVIVYRNVLTSESFAGNLEKLEPGLVPFDFDRYTPGGVYCSVEELKNNPDIGLTRGN